MDATSELLAIRARLDQQLRSTQLEIDAIDKSLALLKRERSATPNGTKSGGLAKLGITDAIRATVTMEPQTPVQIRDRLIQGGVTRKKTNLLNIVYATCSRLAEKGEFEKTTVNGKQIFTRIQKQEGEASA